jgi:hypothetical protein
MLIKNSITGEWINEESIAIRGKKEIFLFSVVSRSALRPIKPSTITGAVCLETKWPGHEAYHSPQSGAEVKNMRSHTFSSPNAFRAWCTLKRYFHIYTYFIYLFV